MPLGASRDRGDALGVPVRACTRLSLFICSLLRFSSRHCGKVLSSLEMPTFFAQCRRQFPVLGALRPLPYTVASSRFIRSRLFSVSSPFLYRLCLRFFSLIEQCPAFGAPPPFLASWVKTRIFSPLLVFVFHLLSRASHFFPLRFAHPQSHVTTLRNAVQ